MSEMTSYERLQATGVCQADEHEKCGGRFRNWDGSISLCTCPCHKGAK